MRRISREACRVHPRHRWAAGPLVPLVGGPAGRPEGFSGPRGGGPREGLHYSTLSSVLSFSSFARTSYPLEEPLDPRRVTYTALHTGADGVDNDPSPSRHLFHATPFSSLSAMNPELRVHSTLYSCRVISMQKISVISCVSLLDSLKSFRTVLRQFLSLAILFIEIVNKTKNGCIESKRDLGWRS